MLTTHYLKWHRTLSALGTAGIDDIAGGQAEVLIGTHPMVKRLRRCKLLTEP